MKGRFDPADVPARLEALRDSPPRDPQAAASGRAAFLLKAQMIREATSVEAPDRLRKAAGIGTMVRQRSRWSGASVRAFTVTAAVVILLFGGAVAIANASQDTLPGNPLYPVKTSLEGAQLALTRDKARNAELHLSFAERRLAELAGLVEDGRYDELAQIAAGYQAHLDSAVQDLETIAETDPGEALRLYGAVTDSMARFVDILTPLTSAVPPGSRAALEGALESSSQSVESMLIGVVDAIGPSTWEITRTDDGERLEIRITGDTVIEDGLRVGDRVRVKTIAAADGSYLGLEIKQAEEAEPEGEAPSAGEDLGAQDSEGQGEYSGSSDEATGDGEAQGWDNSESADAEHGEGDDGGEDHQQDHHEGQQDGGHDGDHEGDD